jgi:hypothetical protein
MMSKLACAILSAALGCSVLGWSVFGLEARAEPLATQGIGTSSCARLVNDLNPGEGLNNPVNVMLLAWVQGYISAANISLLEDDSKHVDLSTLDERKVLSLVVNFCKANPDKKPVIAIDEFIRTAPKVKAKWEPGTIDWDGNTNP